MFYDKSEPQFPNWWDRVDGGGDSEDEKDFDGLSADEIASYLSSEREGQELDRVVGEGTSRLSSLRGNISGYDRETVFRLWEYAESVPGIDEDLWRKDEMGNWIHRLDYGNRGSDFGWEIFDPGIGRRARGVYALRPLQWKSLVERYESLG